MEKEMLHKFYCRQSSNSSAKLSFLFNKKDFLYKKRVCDAIGDVLEDVDYKYLLGLTVSKAETHYNLFKETMMNLVPTGIPQYLFKNFERPDKYRNDKPEESEPFVLAFSHLDFGFYLWLGSLSLPITAFIFEVIFGFFFKKKHVGRDYFEDIGEVRVEIDDDGNLYEEAERASSSDEETQENVLKSDESERVGQMKNIIEEDLIVEDVED